MNRSQYACIERTKTSFEKNCFTAWASTLNMGWINKVDMVCLSPVGYGVLLTFRALALRRSRLNSVYSDEGLTLETSAKHHIPQATNMHRA